MYLCETLNNYLKLKKYFFLVLSIGLFFASCKKDPHVTTSCFDQQLYDSSKTMFCPDDCLGVIGCDGKTYCNECYAAKTGIRVVKNLH